MALCLIQQYKVFKIFEWFVQVQVHLMGQSWLWNPLNFVWTGANGIKYHECHQKYIHQHSSRYYACVNLKHISKPILFNMSYNLALCAIADRGPCEVARGSFYLLSFYTMASSISERPAKYLVWQTETRFSNMLQTRWQTKNVWFYHIFQSI